MGLKSDIDNALKEAIKKKESSSLVALRMLKTSIRNAEVEKGRELEEQEIQEIIRRLIKQRKESVKAFIEGGRNDLAEKEEAEIKVLEKFVPPEMSESEIKTFLKDIIRKVGATSESHIGKVMKEAMKELKGRADGKKVNEIARQLLKEQK